MKVTPLAIPDVLELRPRAHEDERGVFCETYTARLFSRHVQGITFVQDNHSVSHAPYTIRGLHFQKPPHAQDKLVRVVRGSIMDVAVDLRAGSPFHGRHVMIELSARKWNQLWVPKGFAHGFCTLEPDTEVIYKVSDYYTPSHDAGIMWNDPVLGIKWPLPAGVNPVLSPRDRNHPGFADAAEYFVYEG